MVEALSSCELRASPRDLSSGSTTDTLAVPPLPPPTPWASKAPPLCQHTSCALSPVKTARKHRKTATVSLETTAHAPRSGQNSSTTTRQRNLAEMDHPANHQIWVDTPVNTVLDNGPTGQTLSQVYRQQRAQYVKEASASPGVNLVAHTVS